MSLPRRIAHWENNEKQPQAGQKAPRTSVCGTYSTYIIVGYLYKTTD